MSVGVSVGTCCGCPWMSKVLSLQAAVTSPAGGEGAAGAEEERRSGGEEPGCRLRTGTCPGARWGLTFAVGWPAQRNGEGRPAEDGPESGESSWSIKELC